MRKANVLLSKPDASQLLLQALEQHWRDYLKQLKRCRMEFSNEAVHDLRTATQKTMTVIHLLNAIFPRPRLQKIIRTFKNQLDHLDDLWDTQMILAEISETIHELPELQGFQKHQQFVEKNILRALRKDIKKISSAQLSKRIRKTHHFLQARMGENLKLRVMQAVDDVYLVAKQRHMWADPARPATIQRVGTGFKDFRSVVELVHPLLKKFPIENLERMHQYQSLMGEIQDIEVFMQTLTDFLEHTSVSDIEPVCCYYERRHAEAVATYSKRMDDLHLFWRPAPALPFPWEITE